MTECCRLCLHCSNEAKSILIWLIISTPPDVLHQSKMPTLNEKYWKSVLSEAFVCSEICVLPLCNQLWRNPDICCHSCHLLDRTSFAAPLHGILVAIFLVRCKRHSSLDFHVCVNVYTCVCVCLEWYSHHLGEWPTLSVCLYSMFRTNTYINLKANKFHC